MTFKVKDGVVVGSTTALDANGKLATGFSTARTIALSGDVTGSATFDGTANATIVATIAADSVALGTDTTGNYVASLVAGTGISVGAAGEGATPTITNTAPNVTTDISITHNTGSVVVNSSDGLDGTINAATTTLAGVMSSTDKTKLDGIASGATANTGTVTSVSGTGSYGGLSLSGTVTSSGSLTFGGTPTGTWPISISGNAATLGGYSLAQTIPYHSGSDFVNGTLVTTSIPATAANGASFVIEVTGKGYGADVINLMAEGYLYNSTIINYDAIDIGGGFSTNLYMIENGGYLCFWWARMSYWQSFSVKVRDAGGSSANTVTNITDVALPAYTKGVIVTPKKVLNSSNYNSYSPTLTGTGASGTWGISISGNASSASTVNLSGHTISNSSWAGGGGYHGYTYNGGNWRFGFSSTSGVVDVYADGNFYATDSSYLVHHDGNAPRARNSDLMYYAGFTLDANTMPQNSTGFTYSVNAPATGPIARFSTGGGYDMWLNSSYGNGNTLYFRTRQGDAGTLNSWKALVSYGVNYADSLYSTIMYDSNNSGYYCDPSSTSNLSAVNVADSLVRLQKTHTEGGEIRLLNTASTAGGFIQGWDSGIRTVDHNWTTTTWSIDNSGNSIATASHRAPIFYDSNDTSYYCDPNSTTRLSTLRIVGDMYINSASPTIHFVDSNERGAALHNNSNLMYILSSNGTGGESWTQNSGYWPFYINVNDNSATFGGSIWAAGNITAYSDAKLKENIVIVDNALNKVLSLRGVYYTLKRDELKVRKVGVIAQEIQKILPEVVINHIEYDPHTGEAGEHTLSVDYGNITALLIEAIKEQQSQIEELKAKLL